MMHNEREDLIRFIQSHIENKNSENLTTLSDTELRWRAQKIASAQALKNKTLPNQQKKGEQKNQ